MNRVLGRVMMKVLEMLFGPFSVTFIFGRERFERVKTAKRRILCVVVVCGISN